MYYVDDVYDYECFNLILTHFFDNYIEKKKNNKRKNLELL